MAKDDNIVRFRRGIKFDISYVIIAIVVLYVVFHVFSYATTEEITVYEVTKGTIAVDSTYQALAIREESVVSATSEGYIYYYVANLEQVGVRSRVYSIDSSGTINKKLSSGSAVISSISDEDLSALSSSIAEFVYTYDSADFQAVRAFKSTIASELQQYYSEMILEQYASEITAAEAGGSFTYYNAQEVGTVVFQVDGFEDLTVSNYSAENFNSENIHVSLFSNNDSVTVGQSIYKLITSDVWYLVVPISSEQATEIQEDNVNYIEITFLDDNVSTWTSCEVQGKAGNYYLVLTLDDGVSRYATQRLINISFNLEEEEGLKIPNTSIVEKEFFTIPKSYFYKGGDSSSSGVLVIDEEGNAEFVTPTIYYETDDYYYVDSYDIDYGATIRKPDSQITYTVGSETDSLLGVYNINKGYAVFKQIDILYQNADYSIVALGTSYGLSNYDHIALDGNSVSENELIN